MKTFNKTPMLAFAIPVAVLAAAASPVRADSFPPAGTDVFESTLTMTFDLDGSQGLPTGTFTVNLSGPITVFHDADPPGDPQEIETEIVAMNLTGTHDTFGNITMTKQSDPFNSIGLMREIGDSGGLPAEGFFDVFFELSLQTQGVTLLNEVAIYAFNGNIQAIPPISPPSDPFDFLAGVEDFNEGVFLIQQDLDDFPLSDVNLLVEVTEDNFDVVGNMVSGNFTVIPAPGAALLGAIGVGLVGWFRRRIR